MSRRGATPSPEFAEALNRLMQERGVKQLELAEAIGAYSADVGRWRKGSGISIQNVRALADYFGEPWPKWEQLAGYSAPEPDPAGESIIEIRGPVSPERQRLIELVLLVDEAEASTVQRVVRPFTTAANPSGPRAGPRARLRVVRDIARVGGHLALLEAHGQAARSGLPADWRRRLAALPAAAGQ